MEEVTSTALVSGIFTAIATGLLVLVGYAQVVALRGQRRQQSLDQVEIYRKRWADCREEWANVVFFGNNVNAYYQVANYATVKQLRMGVVNMSEEVLGSSYDSMRNVTALLSDIAMRVLQGQLKVGDVYPVFGSELLRHSKQLRRLLQPGYADTESPEAWSVVEDENHREIRNRLITWLVYHDGIRRRCLILIDLLWAEAARLEDLPPDDLKSAADAKVVTGDNRRNRLSSECKRLNGYWDRGLNKQLTNFLRHAEYRRKRSRVGIDPDRLALLDREWVDRLLHNPPN